MTLNIVGTTGQQEKNTVINLSLIPRNSSPSFHILPIFSLDTSFTAAFYSFPHFIVEDWYSL